VTGRGPMGKAPRETKIDEVIADVERRCLERAVYMLGPEKGLSLRGLVEKARPGFVVECGTALGCSGLHILFALQSIGKGMLPTVEIDPIRAREALIAADRRWPAISATFAPASQASFADSTRRFLGPIAKPWK
jgi:predicted O-methyltransferase YrrM